MRRTGLVTLVAALSSLMVAVCAPARALELGPWTRPVAGRVVRPFRAPLTRYGAGHLGVDLAARPGTPVRAAGAGTVVFAGLVAGTRHVVIRHAGDLRTSYSFLADIRVRTGEVVGRGAVVGTAGGTGEAHDGTVLHLGLRVGDTYVDPMRLFAPPDLAAVVHLAAIADPARASPPTPRNEARDLGAAAPRPRPPVVLPGSPVASPAVALLASRCSTTDGGPRHPARHPG